MTPSKAKYRAVVGIDFANGERVEAGELIPATIDVPAWLVDQKLVTDPDDTEATNPVTGEYAFDVQHATVDEVVAWVGDDADKARFALAKEQEADVDTRVTLAEKLERVVAGEA